MANTNSFKNLDSILSVLQAGGKIVFDVSGIEIGIQGDPETNYIDVLNNGNSDGLRILNENGLKEALGDLEKLKELITEED